MGKPKPMGTRKSRTRHRTTPPQRCSLCYPRGIYHNTKKPTTSRSPDITSPSSHYGKTVPTKPPRAGKNDLYSPNLSRKRHYQKIVIVLNFLIPRTLLHVHDRRIVSTYHYNYVVILYFNEDSFTLLL